VKNQQQFSTRRKKMESKSLALIQLSIALVTRSDEIRSASRDLRTRMELLVKDARNQSGVLLGGNHA
jgi:hypothetical protein